MNTVRNYTIIDLRLIIASKVVILLVTYLIQFVFQIIKKKDLNRYIFSLILGKNESKTLTKYKSCEC